LQKENRCFIIFYKMKLNDQQKFALRQKISDYSKELGFDLVGFSKAKIDNKYLREFEKWLKNGYEADMSYMQKIEQRADLGKILPGAKTVIVLGMNYYHEQGALPRGHARVAKYAYGRDYHKVIGKKLKELEKFIGELMDAKSPPDKKSKNSRRLDMGITKAYVDTGPILERAFAEQSGLGRIGKNGCLITEKFGSWIFLAEIITTLDLNLKSSPIKPFPGTESPSRWSDPSQKPFNICGNCTRCLKACPTGAIIAPGIIDSRLCISYLTIENKNKISSHLAKIIKKTKRIFGCDICQEVCPHNKARSRASKNQELFTPKIAGDSLNIKTLCPKNFPKKFPVISDLQFLKIFAGSPLMRAKRKGLQRNAKIL